MNNLSTPRPHARVCCPWYVAAAGLAALFCGIFAGELQQIAKNKLSTFGTYYAAAAALRGGRDPYVRERGEYAYVYPPFYAFALQPLAGLPRRDAARVMLVINGGFVLASALLAARAALARLGQAPMPANVLCVALTATLICGVQIHKELRNLQAGTALLLSFALALYWLDRRPVLAGLALAAGISVKYVPLVAVPYLLLRRRWAAAAATVAGVVAFSLLPALTIGWSANLHYLAMANRGLARVVGGAAPAAAEETAHTHGLADALNISVTSALARLAVARGWPEGAGVGFTLIVFAVWVAGLLLGYRRFALPMFRWPRAPAQAGQPYAGLLALEWAGVLTVALAFNPNAQWVLAVIPATVLAVLLWFPGSRASRPLLAVATFLTLAALVLPIAAMGHPFTISWNRTGLASWCLLVAYWFLSRAGMDQVTTPDPEGTNPPGGASSS